MPTVVRGERGERQLGEEAMLGYFEALILANIPRTGNTELAGLHKGLYQTGSTAIEAEQLRLVDGGVICVMQFSSGRRSAGDFHRGFER